MHIKSWHKGELKYMGEATISIIIHSKSTKDVGLTVNKMKINYIDLKLSQSNMSIGFHIRITILIMTITLIGNGSVFFIFYQRHMVNGSNNFIFAFAVIYINSATLILPQICCDLLVNHCEYNRFIRREVVIVIVNLSILSNVGLLSTVAFDRIWAVFKPFTNAANKRRHIFQMITVT